MMNECLSVLWRSQVCGSICTVIHSVVKWLHASVFNGCVLILSVWPANRSKSINTKDVNINHVNAQIVLKMSYRHDSSFEDWSADKAKHDKLYTTTDWNNPPAGRVSFMMLSWTAVKQMKWFHALMVLYWVLFVERNECELQSVK